MGFFLLLLSLVMLFMFLWSLWASRRMLQGKKRLAFCLFFAMYDFGSIGIMLLYGGNAKGSIPAFILLAFATLLAAQSVMNILVTAAVCFSLAQRRMLSVPFDKEKRVLLKNSFLYPLLSLMLAGYGSAWERNRTVVREIPVVIPKLTARQGFRIAQLSDVHLGPFFSVADWRQLLEKTAELKPDLLAITGDLFDDAEQNPEAVAVLDSFVDRFPCGVYFAFGNHEHFRGFDEICRLLANTRVRVLVNSAEMVQGEKLCLLGVDYPMDRPRFEEQRQEYHRQAMQEMPQGVTGVLLAHHPECIDDGFASRVALTLTGHTHGGQFGVFGLPLFPVFRYNRGLVRQGDCYGYVHSGNGSWFPCRIGCPPEIAVFRLEAEA